MPGSDVCRLDETVAAEWYRSMIFPTMDLCYPYVVVRNGSTTYEGESAHNYDGGACIKA